jgi:hypothetical protein
MTNNYLKLRLNRRETLRNPRPVLKGWTRGIEEKRGIEEIDLIRP